MLLQEYGRRNISILTNAPTGSVSILSQTSSGIEPVFRNSYIRRRKMDHSELEIEADFVDDVGDRWKEFIATFTFTCQNRLNISIQLCKIEYKANVQLNHKRGLHHQTNRQTEIPLFVSNSKIIRFGTTSTRHKRLCARIF